MKKLIVSACAVVASAMALASIVESSNTFGILKVDTGNTGSDRKQYFIGVPWEKVGVGGAISPTALVLPNGLAADDRLYVYNSTSGKFGAWKPGANGWDAVTVVADDAIYESGKDTTVARGSGLVVETASRYIYLSGQYNSTAIGNITIAAATANGPSYTLISAGSADALDLNALTWTGVDKADRIFLSTTEKFAYVNGTWKKVSGTSSTFPYGEEYSDDSATIPVGRAGWYCRVKTTAVSASPKAN